jgi:hypothetical protein
VEYALHAGRADLPVRAGEGRGGRRDRRDQLVQQGLEVPDRSLIVQTYETEPSVEQVTIATVAQRIERYFVGDANEGAERD